MFSNHRISTGGANGRLMEAVMYRKRCELATKERQMKKIVRMLGGAFVLLVMIIGLVSCDDNVAPFDFTKALPKTRSEAEAAIDSIEKDLNAIKDALDAAKNAENIEKVPADYDELMDDVQNINPFLGIPGITTYWFVLCGGDPPEMDHEVLTTIASVAGFSAHKSEENRYDVNIDVRSTFKITKATGAAEIVDNDNSYTIALNASYAKDNLGIDLKNVNGTLKKSGANPLDEVLTKADVLIKDGNFEWNKAAAERHQKILTIFMSSNLPVEKFMEKIIYSSAKGGGMNGEFVKGYTIHDDEGGYWTSATWRKEDGGQNHTIVYSSLEDVFVIDDEVYKLS